MIVEVGRLGRPIGLKGELVLHPISDHPDRFEPGRPLTIDGDEYEIAKCRPYKGKFAIVLRGAASREAAEQLTNKLVFGEELEAPPGQWMVANLVGKEVRDKGGDLLGRVESVHSNPASDLLELVGGGLIPLTFITTVTETIEVEIPDGLLDI